MTMPPTLPPVTCRSLLAGKLICRDAIMPQQVIQYKGPRLEHEPFVNEIHSTVFFSRVILTSAVPPLELLSQAAATHSPHTVAAMLGDCLLPADSLGTGLLISLEPVPAVITVSQA